MAMTKTSTHGCVMASVPEPMRKIKGSCRVDTKLCKWFFGIDVVDTVISFYFGDVAVGGHSTSLALAATKLLIDSRHLARKQIKEYKTRHRVCGAFTKILNRMNAEVDVHLREKIWWKKEEKRWWIRSGHPYRDMRSAFLFGASLHKHHCVPSPCMRMMINAVAPKWNVRILWINNIASRERRSSSSWINNVPLRHACLLQSMTASVLAPFSMGFTKMIFENIPAAFGEAIKCEWDFYYLFHDLNVFFSFSLVVRNCV